MFHFVRRASLQSLALHFDLFIMAHTKDGFLVGRKRQPALPPHEYLQLPAAEPIPDEAAYGAPAAGTTPAAE